MDLIVPGGIGETPQPRIGWYEVTSAPHPRWGHFLPSIRSLVFKQTLLQAPTNRGKNEHKTAAPGLVSGMASLLLCYFVQTS
jgi:hypothetical protein